jgi:protein phosphatase PTC2/3
VACSRQGRRAYNEDRYLCRVRNCSVFEQKTIFANRKEPYDLFAVFDGHGGANCADFLREHFPVLLSRSKYVDSHPEQALRETFEKCEEKFLELCEAKGGGETSGSCAVVCLLVGEQVVVANLGDSRALMLGGGGVLELTRDHKPHEVVEKMRIIKHGGKIYREQEGSLNKIKLFRQMRVLPGNLNVTRTIGDAEVKLRKYGGLPGMISPVPDIASHEKQHFELLLLGSDGLFEAFGSEEIRLMYEEVAGEHEGVAR